MSKKISIIGTGSVGSTLGFHLLSHLNLVELVLLDISSELAKGIALDLEDTRGLLNFSTQIIGTNSFTYIKDSDIVVITAGVARKEGMSRQDLLRINAKVAKEISAEIKKFAPLCIIIVVTNPLDIITYIVTKETKFTRNRVLGMGSSLDTSRLFNLLSQEAKVSTSLLEGFVFGPHNNDMVVSAARLKIKGKVLDEFLKKEDIAKIQEKTTLRGGEIVSFLKDRSANFAPSLACYRLIEAIANDKNEIIPVSIVLNGEYGLQDVCMGVPCLINKKGADKIIEIALTEEEKQKIEKVKVTFKEISNV